LGLPWRQADKPHIVAGRRDPTGCGRQGLEPDLPGQAPAAAGQDGYRETAGWDQSAWHDYHYAACGLSKREIGERLYLSHRTVESHLYRVFPKLEITSRSQLRSVLPEGSPRPE
jgi:hypothetical protein